MRKIWNFLRDVWYWLSTGVRSTEHSYLYDKQEELRKLIMFHAIDQTRTDAEVHTEFLEYVRDYDRPMRLRRTWQLLEEIFEHRPALRAKYSRKEKK